MDSATDEWAFMQNRGSRGPISRAQLAFFLDTGLLQTFIMVHRMSQKATDSRTLAEYVEDWKAESMHYLGEAWVPSCIVLCQQELVIVCSDLACAKSRIMLLDASRDPISDKVIVHCSNPCEPPDWSQGAASLDCCACVVSASVWVM